GDNRGVSVNRGRFGQWKAVRPDRHTTRSRGIFPPRPVFTPGVCLYIDPRLPQQVPSIRRFGEKRTSRTNRLVRQNRWDFAGWFPAAGWWSAIIKGAGPR